MNSMLLERRQRLTDKFNNPVLLFAGDRLSRNFRANQFPFRASSHFLYFAGKSLAGAVLYMDGESSVLFIDFPGEDDALWHGASLRPEELGELLLVDEVKPKSEIGRYAANAATIPLVDPFQRFQQSQILGRDLPEPNKLSGKDLQLAKAIISLRLSHDNEAIAEIKKAVSVSVRAHRRGILSAVTAPSEAIVRSVIESEFTSQQLACAYNSIVSVKGEVLHNEYSPNPLNPGDLLLVDAGSEVHTGWASDITRTYPVSGKFTSTQREIYNIVLEAHDQAITAIKPGIEFRDIHTLATKVITAGLLDLGILQGQLDDLLEHNVGAIFFPHGIGHLLGLDVHDMEDLGDLAGYQEGRQRSKTFGECFLRLSRPLQENMVVTIEPGFYQVPSLQECYRSKAPYKSMVNWQRLEQFKDVRGIRIEDDILVTTSDAKNLSEQLISRPEDIENFMNS